MNAKRIARIIEVLFQGDAPEPVGPLNKRFQWKDPVTGKAPPRIPKSALPGAADFAEIEKEEAMPPGQGDVIEPGDLNGPEANDLTDWVGKHSMNDLMPRGEMATIDDLLDRYLQMQKTHGPEAAKAWFDNYRTAEFESALRKLVDVLLG